MAGLALILAALGLGLMQSAPAWRFTAVFFHQDEYITWPQTQREVMATSDAFIHISHYSHDQKKAALIIPPQLEEPTRLYHIGKTVAPVDRGVRNVRISGDGDTLLYTVQTADQRMALRIFRKGKTQTIAQEKNIDGAVLSPDGKTAAFYTWSDSFAPSRAALWQDGRITPLGEDIWPLAISDGGRYFYYMAGERGYKTGLYVQTGDKRQRLGDVAGITKPYFSSDYSQIVFTSNHQTYIGINGNSRQPLPGEAKMFTGTEWDNRIIDRKDFRNSVYFTEDRKVYQIDEAYQPVYLGRALSWGRLSPNGTTLYFMKNDRLFRADGPPKNGTPFLIGEQVADYRLSDDGRSVGFVTADGGLFIQKDAGKAVKIAYGLDTNWERRPAWQFAFGESSRVFYLANGSLYVSKGGKQGRILPTPAGKALEVRQIGAVLVLTVSVDGENHAYYSTDGKTFLPLAKMPPFPPEPPVEG